MNDSYALTREGGEALKDLCQLIKFDRIRKDVIRVALRRICESELIQWTPDALEELSGRAGGDLRAAVNDLQSLTAGTRVLRMDTLNALGYRDERGKIFEVVVEILKGTGADHARAAMRKLDELPEFVLLWLDENVPLEYKHPDDLERAFNMLSRADVFLGRVSRRQQYGLWGYASDLMSAGVSLAKRRRYHEFNRYRFPLWLIKRSRLKGGSRVEKELLSRIGGYTHLSNYAARHQMLPLFRQLFDSDHNFAVKFVRELGFEPEHIAFILDVESTSPRVRSLLEAAFGSGADRGVTTAMGEFAGADEGDEKPKKPAARKKPAKEIKLGSGDWDEAKQDAGGDKSPGKDKGKDDDAAEDEKGKENSGAKGGAEGEDGDKNQKRLFDF